MSNLVAVAFPDRATAEEVLGTLGRLQTERSIELEDVPLIGVAIGAATGAATGALTDVGIDDRFLKELGAKLQPGGAAVIVLVRRSTPDKVLPEIAHFGGEVIQTSLDDEAEQRLRHALETHVAATV